jgi:hypothetical protein
MRPPNPLKWSRPIDNFSTGYICSILYEPKARDTHDEEKKRLALKYNSYRLVNFT